MNGEGLVVLSSSGESLSYCLIDLAYVGNCTGKPMGTKVLTHICTHSLSIPMAGVPTGYPMDTTLVHHFPLLRLVLDKGQAQPLGQGFKIRGGFTPCRIKGVLH